MGLAAKRLAWQFLNSTSDTLQLVQALTLRKCLGHTSRSKPPAAAMDYVEGSFSLKQRFRVQW